MIDHIQLQFLGGGEREMNGWTAAVGYLTSKSILMLSVPSPIFYVSMGG